jgi:GDPmannose 4,6-dehydratase
LRKGYRVFGFGHRPTLSAFVLSLLENPHFHFVEGNMEDQIKIQRWLEEAAPDELYNLAGMSHVGASFTRPEYTHKVNFFAVKRMSALLFSNYPHAKFYQASSSEMFGNSPAPQNESTAFCPINPYGSSKLAAHNEVVLKWRAKGAFACSGIMFNHESPRRDERFITRKITKGLVRLSKDRSSGPLLLGNIECRRDWGYAEDYVESMWLMLQQEIPNDFVIATGTTHTVKEFLQEACGHLGIVPTFIGTGESAKCYDQAGNEIMRVSLEFFRPSEPAALRGDASKAAKFLKWTAKTPFKQLVGKMVDSDLQLAMFYELPLRLKTGDALIQPCERA